jgi:hypothetical protein
MEKDALRRMNHVNKQKKRPFTRSIEKYITGG